MLKVLMATTSILTGVMATSALADTSTTGANSPADMKLTKAQCDTLWGQASSGSTGDVAMDKAKPFTKDFKKVDTNGDGKLSAVEFQTGCSNGLVQMSQANTPSQQPVTGATGGKTSDRSPGANPDRTPNASSSGAAGTDTGQTPSGTSDRTPAK